MGRDSSVGIATRYGLGGQGIECQWGARFSTPVQTGPVAHPASYKMGTGPFPGVKRQWRGADPPPPSSAEVEERVELYLYSPSGPSWPVLGRPLLLGICYPSEINPPQRHFCAPLSMLTMLLVTGSSTIHTQGLVAFP